LGCEVVVRVVDERNGLRGAVVKIHGRVIAVIPFRDEGSLKRVLDFCQSVSSYFLS
jgi:hypothetical protein